MARTGASSESAHHPDRPQFAAALLEREPGEAAARARPCQAFAGLGPVARAMMAAHQRVVAFVEEPRVAEIEWQQLVTADIEISVERAAIAHDKGVVLHALHHHGEAHAR